MTWKIWVLCIQMLPFMIITTTYDDILLHSHLSIISLGICIIRHYFTLTKLNSLKALYYTVSCEAFSILGTKIPQHGWANALVIWLTCFHGVECYLSVTEQLTHHVWNIFLHTIFWHILLTFWLFWTISICMLFILSNSKMPHQLSCNICHKGIDKFDLMLTGFK